MQKFNIIREDGCIYKNVIVLSTKGTARTARDVRSAIKYENGITVLGKRCMNEFISSKNFYDVEEVISFNNQDE